VLKSRYSGFERSLKNGGKPVWRQVVQLWSAVVAPGAQEEPGWELALRRASGVAVLVAGVGGVWGLVRGLAYPPTVAFAVVEGAMIFVAPGALLGAVVGAVSVLRLRRGRRR
jgi:hypothetical protein